MKMRRDPRFLGVFALAGLLSLAPNAVAATTTTMTLTTPLNYDPNFPASAFGGVYVDPYVATVGGVTGVPVICDDFADDTYLNETWTATILDPTTQLSSSRMTSLGATQVGYEQVAWLSEQLVTYNNSTPSDALQRAYISFAIWSVFDPTDVATWANSHSDLAAALAVSSSTPDSINWWLAQAASNASVADLSNITIYTPSLDSSTYSCPNGCPNKPAQEFIVVKATDSPALATLCLNLLGLGVILFIVRKRRAAGTI